MTSEQLDRADEYCKVLVDRYQRNFPPEWRLLFEKLVGDRDLTRIYLAPFRRYAETLIQALDSEDQSEALIRIGISCEEIRCELENFQRWLLKSLPRPERKRWLEQFPSETREEWKSWLRWPKARLTDRDRDAIRCLVWHEVDKLSAQAIGREKKGFKHLSDKRIRALIKLGGDLVGIEVTSRTYKGKRPAFPIPPLDPTDTSFIA